MLWLNIIIFKRFSCLVRVRLIDVLQVPQCIIPLSTDMKHGRLQFNYGVSIYVSPVFCFKTDSGRKSSVSKSFWVKFKFSVYFFCLVKSVLWFFLFLFFMNSCCDTDWDISFRWAYQNRDWFSQPETPQSSHQGLVAMFSPVNSSYFRVSPTIINRELGKTKMR